MKADPARFPRVQVRYGRSIEVLSPLSDVNAEADARAYVAFMRHLRETDAERPTVLMIQLENEVGVLGDSRDGCHDWFRGRRINEPRAAH